MPSLSFKSLGRSMLATSSCTFLSRISGLARDVIMAWYWGSTGVMQAAFTTAFSIPNTFRALFGEGAFTSVFVPALTAKIEKESKEDAWRLAEKAISLQGTVLGSLVLLVCLAGALIYWLLPASCGEHTRLTFLILPLLMPYALFICLAGAFGSVLNTLRQFALPALNPVLFNIIQVISILLISLGWKMTELPPLLIFCGCTLLAGAAQMLNLAWACRKAGFRFHFSPAWHDPDVRELASRFMTGIIGTGAHQVNIWIDKMIGLALGPVAIGALNYSNHLIFLFTGLFGAAMGTVCLPAMSAACSRQDKQEMADTLDFSLRITLFFCLPCAALLAVLAKPAIAFLFMRGAFTWQGVEECAWALWFYLAGLPAFCCAKIATTPHHANQDMKTPVRISLVCLALNLILNLTLSRFMRQAGLALSTSICSWLNVTLLLWLARRHYLSNWSLNTTLRAAMALLVATAPAALAAYYLQDPVCQLVTNIDILHHEWLRNGLSLAVCGGVGGMVYLGACIGLKRPEPRFLFTLLKR